MNCEMIKEKIDLLIFEDNKQTYEEVTAHIESCDTCKPYFEESLKAAKIIQQMQKEPDLLNPEDLTNSILSQIEEVDQSVKTDDNNTKIYWLIRRSLAAASIALLMVFGIEQYMLFDKISSMEEHISSVPTEDTDFNCSNIISYNIGFRAGSYNNLSVKDFMSSDNLNLKNRIIQMRLSAMALNNMDNQRINRILQGVIAGTTNKTN